MDAADIVVRHHDCHKTWVPDVGVKTLTASPASLRVLIRPLRPTCLTCVLEATSAGAVVRYNAHSP